MTTVPPPLPPDAGDAPPPVPPAPSSPPPPRVVAPANDPRGNGWIGFAIALVSQVLQIPVAFLAIPVARLFGSSASEAQWAVLVPLMFFGVTQWLFIVPIALMLRAYGKTRTASGVLITAGVFFGLNAACLGLMFGVSM